MAVAPERPLTDTGVVLSVDVPLPSWPKPFQPQHLTPPETTAQVSRRLADIAVAPERPETETGIELLAVVPLPSWPSAFQPQHSTAPPVTTAQV